MHVVYVHDANVAKENGNTLLFCSNYLSILYKERKNPVVLYSIYIKKMSNLSEISGYLHFKEKCDKLILPANSAEDLNLNELFERLDNCHSCIGQQYLYYFLLSGKASGADQQEKLITSLSSDAVLYHFLTEALSKLKHPDAYSITSILENPVINMPKKEKWCIGICRFLPLLFLALLLSTHSLLILIPLICSFLANTFLHYRNKTKIQEYFFSIPQLLQLIKKAEQLAQRPELAATNPEITSDLQVVKGLKRYISYFRFNLRLESDMAIIAYLIAEQVRIFFLHEAYAVSRVSYLLKDKIGAIHNIYRFIGFLDVIVSIAELRKTLPYYCLPKKNKEGERLCAQAVYHPLIEDCVANDLILQDKSALITGSNMSGKTSFIRTIGINLLTAKVLHTCFAQCFEIDTDLALLTSIRQNDSLTEGKSYFMQEVLTIKDFVSRSNGNCMFLLDELFKGTNTKERIAITKAVLSWLAEKGNLVFTSSHDTELSDLLGDKYELYYFCEAVKDDTLYFDYKLKAGITTERNAIKLLESCGYPPELIQSAYTYLAN